MLETDEFCTCDSHHEGVEVFGSQKQKLDTPIRADEETHRPDTINFSRPLTVKKVTRARAASLPTILEKHSPTVEEVCEG